MEIVVVGAHGKIALHFERLASEAGHRVRGLARNPDHSPDIIATGAEPVIADLETDDITESVGRADAVVFAAGARPGRLTDDPPTGKVDIAVTLGRRGQIPRADVAAVLLACLEDTNTVGRTFELLGGDTPIADALQSL